MCNASNSGPSTFSIKPGDSYFYPLKFIPSHSLEYSGKLAISNLTDGTSDSFCLVGMGLEPLPDGKVEFGEIKCYQRYKAKIHLPR